MEIPTLLRSVEARSICHVCTLPHLTNWDIVIATHEPQSSSKLDGRSMQPSSLAFGVLRPYRLSLGRLGPAFIERRRCDLAFDRCGHEQKYLHTVILMETVVVLAEHVAAPPEQRLYYLGFICIPDSATGGGVAWAADVVSVHAATVLNGTR